MPSNIVICNLAADPNLMNYVLHDTCGSDVNVIDVKMAAH